MSRARHGQRHAPRRFITSGIASILIALGGIAPASVTPVAAAGDFQLLVSPANQLLPPGGSVSFLVQVGSVGGFADPVTLTVGTLPAGVTYQLSDDTVTPPATEHLTLIASEDAEVGDFSVVVTGTSGALQHTASGSATVDFGLIPVCYAKVKGTVTDRTTGQPLQGVQLPQFQVFTDSQGHYAFDKVGLGTNNAPITFQVMATKDGYWTSFSDAADFVCAQETTVDLTMLAWIPGEAHGRIVEGTVDATDPDIVIPGQTPISGIQVGFNVSLIPGSGPDTTGADGLFQLRLDHLGTDNTPLGLSLFAQESVNFTDQVYWPRGGSTPSPIDIGDVAPDDDVNVGDIGLVRKCFGSVTGTLKYGDTNLPAVGVSVRAQHGWWFSDDTTDATGAYDIPIVSLGYNNQPTDVDVIAVDGTGFYSSAESQTHFAACGDAKVVPLVFPAVNLGSLAGRVTDEETDAALPGAQVAFSFTPCPTCDPYPGIADATGDYRIDRIPAAADPPPVATYTVEANSSGYWFTRHSVDILKGEVTQRDFELLKKKFASLRGRVTDAITGDPIAGAQGGAQHVTTRATTAANGTYTQSNIDIGYRNEPLSGSVRFIADGYWPAQASATFEANKETVVDLELIPVCDGATIRGRVVDATNQQPLEDATVTVIGNGQDVTDANGRYEITDIQVGDNNSPTSVTVFAGKEGYFSQSKVITVFCGASISIDFGRKPPHMGALEGFVTNAVTGDPIGNVKIVGAFGEETTTDGDGHYLFPEVPVNDDGSDKVWDVSALPDGFDHQTKPVTVKDDETARLDFQFGGVQPPLTGKIVVQVATQPSGSAQSFSFTPSYGSAFNLTDGVSNDSGPLEAGKTYSVSQAAVDGWDTTASCDHGQTPGSIALAADTTVTCTFTNVQRGTIIVQKTANGGDATFAFTSQTLGNFNISTSSGSGSRQFEEVVPGPYAVAESAKTGWDPRSATCTGGNTPAAISVGAGQTVTCTFVNDKRGTASVRKTVSGGALTSSQSFAFELREGASATAAGTLLGSGSATSGNGGSISFSPSLVAGATYQLCEVVLPGWQTSLGPNPFTLFNASGDNSTLCADFAIQPGQARVVAINNTPPPGGLTRTIGFWKNWSSCSKGKQAPVLDRTLAKSEPTGISIGRLTLHGSSTRPDVAPDCTKAFNLLDKTTIDGKKKSASDPAFNMAAQLLAAKLNGVAGAGTCGAATAAITDGQALLQSVAFDGLTHAKLTGAQTAQANTLATTLDRYNNGLLC
jgi:carboxypeptidase family protein/prealbumin domain-containing protein